MITSQTLDPHYTAFHDGTHFWLECHDKLRQFNGPYFRIMPVYEGQLTLLGAYSTPTPILIAMQRYITTMLVARKLIDGAP